MPWFVFWTVHTIRLSLKLQEVTFKVKGVKDSIKANKSTGYHLDTSAGNESAITVSMKDNKALRTNRSMI